MSRITRLCAKRGLEVIVTRGNIYLRHGWKTGRTPYKAEDWEGQEVRVDRVVACLVAELGAVAEGLRVRRFGNRKFLKMMWALLGNLLPWVEALEADLGPTDRETIREQFSYLGLDEEDIRDLRIVAGNYL